MDKFKNETVQIFLNFRVVVAASNQTFSSVESVVGVGDSLAFGRHSHESLSISCEGYH